MLLGATRRRARGWATDSCARGDDPPARGARDDGDGAELDIVPSGRHPGGRAARAEVADALGGRTPAPGNLPRLPYTRMVVEEAMRLYPPVWGFSRPAPGPDALGGHAVPAGDVVFSAPT